LIFLNSEFYLFSKNKRKSNNVRIVVRQPMGSYREVLPPPLLPPSSFLLPPPSSLLPPPYPSGPAEFQEFPWSLPPPYPSLVPDPLPPFILSYRPIPPLSSLKTHTSESKRSAYKEFRQGRRREKRGAERKRERERVERRRKGKEGRGGK
jgi:hypothetical protein